MALLGDLSIIENGIYVAMWSGYNVVIAFSNGNLSDNIPTVEGIRGFSTVLVGIKDGKGTILDATNKEIEEISETYRVKPDFFNRFHHKIK